MNRCNTCRHPVEGKDSLCKVCTINKEEREISKKAKGIRDGFMQLTKDKPLGYSNIGGLDAPYSPITHVPPVVAKEVEKPLNKYMREIKPDVWVDVYDVLRAFNVTDAAFQHAIKKLLA